MNNQPKVTKMSAAARAHIAASAKARWARIKARVAGEKALPAEMEVLPPVKAAKVPQIEGGGDKAVAKQLNKLYADAQNGMRKIIALGLFAWEVKEQQLKHGEFGAWLAEHCPRLATTHSATGKPMASRALNGYMELTLSVLDAAGIPTIKGYLETVAKSANDADLKPGSFLLIADKKVPENIKGVREKIFEIVDGKTQRQLFTEFKQADDEGNKQTGRTKGSAGNPRHQRVDAAERELQERVTAKKLKALEIAEWLVEMSDDKGLGEISGSEELGQLDKAMETARGYIKHHGGGQ